MEENLDAQKVSAEIRKIDLESQKLKAEKEKIEFEYNELLKEANRKWLFKRNTWSGIAKFIIGAGFLAFYINYAVVPRYEIDNRKAELENLDDQKKLSHLSDSLSLLEKTLANTQKDLDNREKLYQHSVDSLKQRSDLLVSSLTNSKQLTVDSFKRKIESYRTFLDKTSSSLGSSKTDTIFLASSSDMIAKSLVLHPNEFYVGHNGIKSPFKALDNYSAYALISSNEVQFTVVKESMSSYKLRYTFSSANRNYYFKYNGNEVSFIDARPQKKL